MSSFRGAGVIGVPPGVKEGGKRVDVKSLNAANDTDFDFLIETKCPRYGWARASLCPCVGFNDDTDQADPGCSLCNAVGWLYSKPDSYKADPKQIGELDEVQCELLDNANAVAIKALLVNASSQPDIYNILGAFSLGTCSCTVRSGNRLGYYDRLISLDDEMVYSEVIVADGTDRLKTKYPVVAINTMRSLTTVYCDADLTLEGGAGEVVWITGSVPALGERISVHYVCRPVWTVMEHTKLNRTTLIKQKKAKPGTPTGDIVALPPQVLVRLEHLPLNPSD